MKRVFISALVCLAAAVISCSCKEVKGFKAQLLSENEKIDTLSYIVGMDVANSIEKNTLTTSFLNCISKMNGLWKNVQSLDLHQKTHKTSM